MVSADLMGPFPRSKKGNTSLLVVNDWFSKYVCLFPIKAAKAKKVVDIVENQIFLQYGVPEIFIMDNGPQFARSKDMKNLLNRYGIKKSWNNCGYHPQSNFTERHNRNIGVALRAYIKESHKDWDKYIAEITLALRTAVHSITGYSPFFLNHAREYVADGSDYTLSKVNNMDDNQNHTKKGQNFLKDFTIFRTTLT